VAVFAAAGEPHPLPRRASDRALLLLIGAH
jgi:hypothetical protein